MKFKKLVAGFIVGFALAMPVSVALEGVISEPMIVEAVDDLGDDVGTGTNSSGDNGMSDFIKGWENVDGEQLQDASVKLTPITNLIGWGVGALTVLVVAAVPIITLLDLAYIAIPPVRNLLFVDGQQAPTGGGYGGYGMQQQQTTHEKRQWVSDEAVQCATLIGNNQQSGAMSQGGPYGASVQQTQQNMPTKSVIGVYFKKRIFFIILFVLCLVVLTSSILLGTGVNLAQWVMNIINEVNNFIPR